MSTACRSFRCANPCPRAAWQNCQTNRQTDGRTDGQRRQPCRSLQVTQATENWIHYAAAQRLTVGLSLSLSLFASPCHCLSLSLSVCLYVCLSCSPYNGDGSIVTVASAVPQLHSCAAVPAEPKVESAFSCPDMPVCLCVSLCVCLSGCRLADFCQRLADAVADCLSNCESSRAKPKTGKLANCNCNCSNRDSNWVVAVACAHLQQQSCA